MKISFKFLIVIVFIVCICCVYVKTKNHDKEEADIINKTYFTKRVKPSINEELAVVGTAESFTVSKIFSDNMVIQRDDYIRIWGWAPKSEEGKVISASFMGLYGNAIVENGEWMITMGGTLPVSKSLENVLVILGAGEEKVFEHVLVGDVYLVTGQSNAAYTVESVMENAPETDLGSQFEFSEGDNIRIHSNSTHVVAIPKDASENISEQVISSKGWVIPSKKITSQMSALGYFFGKQLVTETNNEIPIGVIVVDADAAALAAFTPAEVAEQLGSDSWNEKMNCYSAKSLLGDVSTRWVYNALLYPIRKLPIRGIVWYQGESDSTIETYPSYINRFSAVITEVRKRCDLDGYEIPVFMVEFPTIYSLGIEMGNIRTQLGRIPTHLSNCFIAAGSDLWQDSLNENNLHPYCKWGQAKRVVDMVVSLIYEGDNQIRYTAGPLLNTIAYTNNSKRVELTYRYVGDCLQSKGDLVGFELLLNGIWVPATDLTISGKNKVVITSQNKIQGVRYNYTSKASFPESVSLMSSSGVPAIAYIDILPE